MADAIHQRMSSNRGESTVPTAVTLHSSALVWRLTILGGRLRPRGRRLQRRVHQVLESVHAGCAYGGVLSSVPSAHRGRKTYQRPRYQANRFGKRLEMTFRSHSVHTATFSGGAQLIEITVRRAVALHRSRPSGSIHWSRTRSRRPPIRTNVLGTQSSAPTAHMSWETYPRPRSQANRL